MAAIDAIDPLQDQIEQLLVQGNFRELEALALGQGMSACGIRDAIAACGRTLSEWPIDRSTRAIRNISQHGRPGGDWTRTFPMWTLEDHKPVVWVTFAVSNTGNGNRYIAIQSIELKNED